MPSPAIPTTVDVDLVDEDVAADRLARAPESSRERFVHDGHRLRAAAIGRIDGSAALDRDPHQIEVPGRDDVGEEGHRLSRTGHVPVDVRLQGVVAEKTERYERRGRGGAHARQHGELLEDAFDQDSPRPVRGHAGQLEVDRREHDLLGVAKSQIDLLQLVETAEEESRRDEHGQRQRELGGDERPAHAAAAAGAPACASARERRPHGDARRLQRGRESEHEDRHHAGAGKDEPGRARRSACRS